jgi:hypothetical protein
MTPFDGGELFLDTILIIKIYTFRKHIFQNLQTREQPFYFLCFHFTFLNKKKLYGVPLFESVFLVFLTYMFE